MFMGGCALALALAAPGHVQAAGPIVGSPLVATQLATEMASTELVQYRGRSYAGNWRGRRNWGRNAAIGLGLGVLGGAIASGAYANRYYDDPYVGYDDRYVGRAVEYDNDDVYEGNDDGVRRCAATFRSFEPETGQYTTYGGEKRMCPYL
jgi:BA14K-like protein